MDNDELLNSFLNFPKRKNFQRYKKIFDTFEKNNGRFKPIFNIYAFAGGLAFLFNKKINNTLINFLLFLVIIFLMFFSDFSRGGSIFWQRFYGFFITLHIVIGFCANYLFYLKYKKEKQNIQSITTDINVQTKIMNVFGRNSTHLDSKKPQIYMFTVQIIIYYILYSFITSDVTIHQ